MAKNKYHKQANLFGPAASEWKVDGPDAAYSYTTSKTRDVYVWLRHIATGRTMCVNVRVPR